MGGELERRGGRELLIDEDQPPRITKFSEVFEKVCPTYMAMGMSYDMFWYGDVCAAKAYKQAFEIKQELENQRLWLQGMYVYDAVSRLYPLFNPLTKTKTIEPYVKEPYPLTKRTKEISEVKKADEKALKDFEFFKARIAAINARRDKEEMEAKQQAERRD